MTGFALLTLLAAVAPAPCDIDGSGHVDKPLAVAVPALIKGGWLPAKIWSGLRAVDVSSALEVDETVLRFILAGERAMPVTRLPLALPSPWSGSIELSPRAVEGGFCARAEVVLFDKELRRARFVGLPYDVKVSFARKGAAARTIAVRQEALVFSSGTIDAQVEGERGVRLWIGDGPPDEAALLVDGADTYMSSLAALGSDVVDDIRRAPSKQAQRVLFAEAAAAWRADLRSWTPARRIDAIARFDEKAMPAATRPLLRFWKSELSPGLAAEARASASARLLVDDAVVALWIDGIEVFARDRGMPTSVEVPAPKVGVRAWIVTKESGVPVVHDTRAVLRAGEIYAVTSTFVQHVRGGGRRECVRVSGALPFGKDIRWREISNAPSTRPGPMLGDDETYRPSVSSAERALTVVPGGDTRPFPPVPLVYSYTHPGTYKWTLAKDGGVSLDLVVDDKLCPVP